MPAQKKKSIKRKKQHAPAPSQQSQQQQQITTTDLQQVNSDSSSTTGASDSFESSNLESCNAAAQDPSVRDQILKAKPVIDFMQQRVNAEKNKLARQGAQVKILRVKNTALIHQEVSEEEEQQSTGNTPPTTKTSTPSSPATATETKILNRVEVDTNIDFDAIQQLLVSDPEPCTVMENHNYVNVIVLMTSGLAYLLPYIFPQNDKNSLKSWVFINNQLKRTDISIDQYDDIPQQ